MGERVRATYAAIDLDALAHNLAEVSRLAPGRAVIGVVKADAYGHGAVAVARRLVAEGCERLAVVSVEEAAELREADVTAPLLVLGGVNGPEEAEAMIALGATAVIHGADSLPWLEAAAGPGPAPVQIEVDTAMHRMGLAPEHALETLRRVAESPRLHLEGVFTHLARADEPDLAPSRAQLHAFAELLDQLRVAGIAPGCIHFANSAGVLQGEALRRDEPAGVDSVRPGLMLYGGLPARFQSERVSLKPVMSLRSQVVNVHEVRSGDPVGYGATWRAPAPGFTATVPLGYADGVPWTLGAPGHAERPAGEALLSGRRVRFAGRVSMDYVTLDAGKGPVRPGDEVVLFGVSAQGEAHLPVEEVAHRAGTLSYELLVRVGSRVRRMLVRDPAR